MKQQKLIEQQRLLEQQQEADRIRLQQLDENMAMTQKYLQEIEKIQRQAQKTVEISKSSISTIQNSMNDLKESQEYFKKKDEEMDRLQRDGKNYILKMMDQLNQINEEKQKAVKVEQVSVEQGVQMINEAENVMFVLGKQQQQNQKQYQEYDQDYQELKKILEQYEDDKVTIDQVYKKVKEYNQMHQSQVDDELVGLMNTIAYKQRYLIVQDHNIKMDKKLEVDWYFPNGNTNLLVCKDNCKEDWQLYQDQPIRCDCGQYLLPYVNWKDQLDQYEYLCDESKLIKQMSGCDLIVCLEYGLDNLYINSKLKREQQSYVTILEISQQSRLTNGDIRFIEGNVNQNISHIIKLINCQQDSQQLENQQIQSGSQQILNENKDGMKDNEYEQQYKQIFELD